MASTNKMCPQQLMILYGIAAVIFFVTLVHTLLHHPLVPFQMNNAEWASAWLITTIADYYVLGFCISTIIYTSESSIATAAFWIFMVNGLGSMWFCVYLILRLRKTKSVSLVGGDGSGGDQGQNNMQQGLLW